MSRRAGGHRNTLRCPACHAAVAVLRDRRYLRIAATARALYTDGDLTVACGACGAERTLGDLYLEAGDGLLLTVGDPPVW